MKVKFHRSIPKDQALFFSRVFDLLVPKLGIADFERTILVSYGRATNNPKEAGAFGPQRSHETIDRVLSGKTPMTFGIKMMPDEVSEMLVAFAHEMVHLKQACFGEQAYGVADDGYPVSLWQGIPIPKGSMSYEDLPWEKEPHERMYELALWAAREYVNKFGQLPYWSRNGINNYERTAA